MNDTRTFLYPLNFHYYETGLCSRMERVIPLFHHYCMYHYPENLNTEKFSWHLELLILFFEEIRHSIDTVFEDRRTNVLALIEMQPCLLRYIEWSQVSGIQSHMSCYYSHEMNNFNSMSWFLWNNEHLWQEYPLLDNLFFLLRTLYGQHILSMKDFIKYRDIIYDTLREETTDGHEIALII